MKELERSFVQLVKLGIGTSNEASIPLQTNWESLMTLASKQGLSAVVLDGIERLAGNQCPPKVLILQWIGEVLQSYENRFELYRRAIAELAGFYNEHSLKMMLLKGYACSICWPKPEHRPCGDIDIWLYGHQKEADALLTKWKGITIDVSKHHHTVFHWREFMVENHYDFLDIYHHKSNAEMEKLLKELGKDDNYSLELCGERVYLPSPNLHALFLLRHMMSHFAATEITLRHVLDWAFFVEKNKKNVDWTWLKGVLFDYGMIKMFNLINAICVDDLGFSHSLFPAGDVDLEQKNKVFEEIVSPFNYGQVPTGLFKRIFWKYRRWRANAWKHELCYKDSMWSAFWSGVLGHLLKPRTI